MKRVLIIGAGPAGVSAALYARRGGLTVTVAARDGGALEKAEKIENYYGLAKPVTGAELFRRGVAGAERLGVVFAWLEIVSLQLNENLTGFKAVSKEGWVHEAEAVVLATGASRRRPLIPGLAEREGRGVSYCAVCDAFFYRGKEVAVLGAGAYALHEAATLLPLAGKVTLLTDGQPAPEGIPAGCEVRKEKVAALEGAGRVEQVRFAAGDPLPVSGVFVALGTAGGSDFARTLGAVLEKGRLKVDGDGQTSVPGLFAAGDCNGGLLQVVKAAHEGAAAGLAVVRYLRDRED